MKFYQSIRKLWQQPKQNLGDLWQKRLVEWRKEASTVKLERPTRLDRARSLGYRSKEGIIVFRQKLSRGGKKKQVFGRRGRRPKRYGQKLVLNKSYQQVAEERVAKKHPNLEVLNSYYVAKDGKHSWYEVIMVDCDVERGVRAFEERSGPDVDICVCASCGTGDTHRADGGYVLVSSFWGGKDVYLENHI